MRLRCNDMNKYVSTCLFGIPSISCNRLNDRQILIKSMEYIMGVIPIGIYRLYFYIAKGESEPLGTRKQRKTSRRLML